MAVKAAHSYTAIYVIVSMLGVSIRVLHSLGSSKTFQQHGSRFAPFFARCIRQDCDFTKQCIILDLKSLN